MRIHEAPWGFGSQDATASDSRVTLRSFLKWPSSRWTLLSVTTCHSSPLVHLLIWPPHPTDVILGSVSCSAPRHHLCLLPFLWCVRVVTTSRIFLTTPDITFLPQHLLSCSVKVTPHVTVAWWWGSERLGFNVRGMVVTIRSEVVGSPG